MWHDVSSMVSDDELCGIMYDYVPSCTHDGRTICSYNELCMQMYGIEWLCHILLSYV